MAKKASRKKGNPISRYLRETVAELRKVTWPTRREATQLTGIVLIVIVLMSVFLGAMDVLFSRLISVVINLG